MFQDAIDSNFESVISFAGKRVAYRLISTSVATTLSAVAGKSNHEIETQFGILTKSTRDYIVRTSDLPSMPVPGDRIEELIRGELHIYEVYSPDGNDCYYHADPEQKWTRIHTQLVDIE